MIAATHRFEPHTADVRLHLVAPDLATLLGEAGRALSELLVEAPSFEDDRAEAPLELDVSAPDREALLVSWIDELIGRSELERVSFTRFEVTCPSPTRALARVWTAPLTEVKTAPKAATWHGLTVREVPGGLEATVVLDV